MLLGQYLPTEQRGEPCGAPSGSFIVPVSLLGPLSLHVLRASLMSSFILQTSTDPENPRGDLLRVSSRTGLDSSPNSVTNQLDGHLTNLSEHQFIICKVQVMIPFHELDVMMEGAYAWKVPNLAPGKQSSS